MSVTEPDKWLRVGASEARDVRLDWLVLGGLVLVLIASGIGLRDPWPADEPRFALVVRDMVATGDWLIPRIGGDVYGDKPPLFFWLMALALEATHSLRFSFLLPSLLSALGCVLLTYDLARRLWNREAGLAAGLSLLVTLQFVWQARQAQIDATLCFWTTLSLYGLLRHLLLGPSTRWYAIGWAAAGLGVITKGVGFLPLLILIPALWLQLRHWSPRIFAVRPVQWLLGVVAFVAAVSVWLVPVLLAARGNPQLQAYRDEILFHQTLTRYANAWQHREPFWYFIVEVIPVLWLPFSALLPWLVPRWRDAWRARDPRIALPLAWMLLVVLFFSLSSGKRGVYVLPAVPALALIAAPYVAELLRHRAVQRVLFGLAVLVGAICAGAALFLLIEPQQRAEVTADYGVQALGPLLVMALCVAIVCALTRVARGHVAFGGVLASVLLVVSFWVNPQMNDIRSGAAFVRSIEARLQPGQELGFFGFREQYLLTVQRPITHFGHERWAMGEEEASDAALWLSGSPNRVLVINEWARTHCFAHAKIVPLGVANRRQWYLASGTPDETCVRHGETSSVFHYTPPAALR